MNRRLLDVLTGEEPDATPVWLMRQAGRYLPGYRTLRESHSILELAKDPALAAQVAEEPTRRFDVDAAIVFADIIHPLEGLGLEVRLDPGQGPVVPAPIRRAEDLRRLETPLDAEGRTGFVGATIRKLRETVSLPIIGFSAAPFTLACYALQGSYEREFPEVRRRIASDADFFRRFMMVLSASVIEYLRMQEKAGAQVIQLFDTWAGVLSESQYSTLVAPFLAEVLTSVEVPTIYFSTSSAHLLGIQASLGATALSVDWRMGLDEVAKIAGDSLVLQGNLDPTALLDSRETMERAAKDVLASVPRGTSHIFNLGHGVLPTTDPQRVKELVDLVHSETERG